MLKLRTLFNGLFAFFSLWQDWGEILGFLPTAQSKVTKSKSEKVGNPSFFIRERRARRRGSVQSETCTSIKIFLRQLPVGILSRSRTPLNLPQFKIWMQECGRVRRHTHLYKHNSQTTFPLKETCANYISLGRKVFNQWNSISLKPYRLTCRFIRHSLDQEAFHTSHMAEEVHLKNEKRKEIANGKGGITSFFEQLLQMDCGSNCLRMVVYKMPFSWFVFPIKIIIRVILNTFFIFLTYIFTILTHFYIAHIPMLDGMSISGLNMRI